MFKMRCGFAKGCVSLVALIFLAGCQQVKVSGLDACAKDVEITVKQGAEKQVVSVALTSGSAQIELKDAFNLANDVHVEIKVKSVHDKAECKEREAEIKSKTSRFIGKFTAVTEGGHKFDASPKNVTRSRASSATGGGTVEGGTLPPPRSRGKNGLGVAVWAKGIPNCTKICWQQWVKTQIYIDKADGAGFQEIWNGRDWTDPAGNPQKYGSFGKDLPDGSVGDCYALRDVKNLSGQKGMVDMPGFDVTDARARTLQVIGLQHGVGRTVGSVFSLRYNFDAYSILVCEQPAPVKTIGYYHWKAEQTWKLTRTASDIDHDVSYQVPLEPQWTNGKSGLPTGVTAP